MIGEVSAGVSAPERVYAMAETALHRALSLYQGNPRAVDWLEQHLQRLTEPLRIVVTGRRHAGKSTVLNALIGEEVAPADTRLPTWYLDGPAPQAFAVSPGRPVQELAIPAPGGHAAPGPRAPTEVPPDAEKLVVEWPARSLRGLVLIDTPGPDLLGPEDPLWPELHRTIAEADAIIHLADGPAGPNAEFLAAAHHSPLARATAVNTVVVLGRADELGAGRIDAMSAAKQLARRAGRESTFSPLCQGVLPVAGLLAQGSRTIQTAEFDILASVAALSRDDQQRVSLSADRFLAAAPAIGNSPALHEDLLRRFGLFGIRLAATLIRRGFNTPLKLAAELLQRSGLNELRDTIGEQFTGRGDVLKARSALVGLETLLQADPAPHAGELVADLEQILANAHEFRELRLLAALRCGRAQLPPETGLEAEQLIGGHGAHPAERLGVSGDASREDLLHTAAESLDRWRLLAVNPLATRADTHAVQTVVRSCEGLIVNLAQ